MLALISHMDRTSLYKGDKLRSHIILTVYCPYPSVIHTCYLLALRYPNPSCSAQLNIRSGTDEGPTKQRCRSSNRISPLKVTT